MLLCLLWTGSTDVYGQKARQRRMGVRVDSLALKQQAITDSLATDSITTDSLAILNQKEIEKLEAPVDTALLAKIMERAAASYGDVQRKRKDLFPIRTVLHGWL